MCLIYNDTFFTQMHSRANQFVCKFSSLSRLGLKRVNTQETVFTQQQQDRILDLVCVDVFLFVYFKQESNLGIL